MRTVVGWGTICLLLLAVVLVPFVLFEAQAAGAVDALLLGNHGRQFLAVALGALLAADIFLPVPSSLVSTACGSLLGFGGGMLVSWVGMTAGCVLGYVLGAVAGRPVVARLGGEKEMTRVELALERRGQWMIILFRAMPVLAEVSVMFAGVCRMPLGRFLSTSALANLGISAAHAGVGARAVGAGSFLLAFAGALLLPATACLIARLLKT